LATVLEHLRQSPFCGPIGLWGRSMGAVTVLLHADRDQSLGAICLDSPFVTLRQLIEDLAKSVHIACSLPCWFVAAAHQLIRMRVKALANFDVDDVVPLEHAKRCYVPAIFMHGSKDTFISPKHSRQIYDAYLGDKEYLTIDGDHNSERSYRDNARAVDFFCRAFRLDQVDLGIIPEDVYPDLTGTSHYYCGALLPPQLDPPLAPPPAAQPVPEVIKTDSNHDLEDTTEDKQQSTEITSEVQRQSPSREGSPLTSDVHRQSPLRDSSPLSDRYSKSINLLINSTAGTLRNAQRRGGKAAHGGG